MSLGERTAGDSSLRRETKASGVVRLIEMLNRLGGRVAGIACLVMILLGAFNTLARYSDRRTGWDLSSNAYLEAQWYLFSIVFLLAGAYTLGEGRHVRVDLLYGRLSQGGKAWIDLLGSTLFLIPFSVFGLVSSWPSVRNSWAVREGSPDPDGLARYPIKTVVLLGFALLLLQGLAEVIKNVRVLRGDDGDRDSALEGIDALSGEPRREELHER